MLKRSLEHLDVKEDGCYIDATLGEGGHSRAILSRLTGGHLIAIDRDPQYIEIAKLKWADHRVSLYCSLFSNVDIVVNTPVDGILADLGTCTSQLTSNRGFSFQHDGPLDMRMGCNSKVTGLQVLHRYSVKSLQRMFDIYGGEKQAKLFARVIKDNLHSIVSSNDLASLLSRHNRMVQKIHPATRVFQALRVEVNNEVKELINFLQKAYSILKSGGRLVVITFNSLEDRITKKFMQSVVRQTKNEIFDSRSSHKAEWCVNKEKPNRQEIADNPGSRSAVLRCIRRV